MRSDIVPGSTFPDHALPDHTLPDHTGAVRTLSELQGDDPLVLTLARGHYCPEEHQHVVHSIYNGYRFWGRPSTDDLWRDLRAAGREVRPDWDLAAPGLREAWTAGDRSRFHGWDRSG